MSQALGKLATMNKIGDEDLERVLAQACEVAAGEDFQSVVTVASALRKLAGDEADPRRALIAGLEYHLVLDEERRAGQGAFGPMMEGGYGRWDYSIPRRLRPLREACCLKSITSLQASAGSSQR